MYRLEDILMEGTEHTLNEHAIQALTVFKELKTSKTENRHLRQPGMQNLVNSLITAYNLCARIHVLGVQTDAPAPENDGVNEYVIELSGRLSIISLLNAFFRIVQIENHEPVEFLPRQRAAILLFKKVYPEQFARLEFHPDSGGFSLPGRSLGFRAQVMAPNALEVEEPAPLEWSEAIYNRVSRRAAVHPPYEVHDVFEGSMDVSEAVRTIIGDVDQAPQLTSTRDESAEGTDERDEDYYENESPER